MIMNELNFKMITALMTSIMLTCSCEEHEFGNGSPDTGISSDQEVPGTVICHYKASSRIFPGSPGICILDDGTYLVSVEEGGPGCPSPKCTDIYASYDKGNEWTLLSSISDGQAWSNIFELDGNVYVMGVDAPHGNIVIRKSDDKGKSWTKDVTPDNGLIRSGQFHTAPVPVVIHDGYIYRAFEAFNPDLPVWPKQYNAMILSAPVGADLMKAESWEASNQLIYNSSYLDGYFGGWLEGNAVPGPDNEMKLVMRVEVPANIEERIAVIDVSENGKQISFDAENGFHEMPGGAKKFTIRYDEKSGRYWTLSNYVKAEHFNMNPGYVRNVLVLCSSVDLKSWIPHVEVLSHPDVKNHAFQYIDWRIDGNDMVFVSRTAYDDRYGGADSYHNANYITFHRLVDFRKNISYVYEE